MATDIQMTPGNREPSRYRKSVLTAGVASLIAAGASAPTIYSKFLDEQEGNRLAAYADGKGIWTICRGLTRIDGLPVVQGMKLSKEQCDFYSREHIDEALAAMRERAGPERWDALSEPAKAGISSWCWTNIGWPLCSHSTFWRMFMGGASRNDYCAQITYWIRDNGKDCRKAGSNCQGQPVRRMREDELCLIPKVPT